VRLRGGRIYSGTVRLDGWWVHLSDPVRLSRHLDGFAGRRIDDLTIAARDVERITWVADESLEAAA
jgi:hypothetical protein